ncbi:phospholipase D-like domain-containing protein [Mycobacterium sp.]|uniref:phospholipase D-like domain-containing protein n=1 Tax=Mycobacterium sp. TaxID=1785 RepID=UPI002C470AF6|nr:phospholipase D-like domain-containing protein [Mycobacterium sp.]HTY31245.1 phospholipase D-like domain-containing protein [Mycobacterium sp.]
MGIEGVFSSVVGGDGVRARVLELIADASAKAGRHAVDINVMMFSFTDPLIADALASAARQPGLNVRLIADWTARGVDGHQQVGRLAQLRLPSLSVRYKKDQPYVWDATAAHIRWSYRASRGLLHHKTVSVVVDGEPWRLICGSFNWTAKAVHSYENILILTDSTAECRDIMSRVELEFEALWSDGRCSLSPDEAQAHYESIIDIYHRDPMTAPNSIDGLAHGRDDALNVLNSRYYSSSDSVPHILGSDPVVIAFSACLPHEEKSRAGYAESNNRRYISLRSPSGRVKRAPLTITALALDVIFRAGPGETLLIAMHGLSQRIPEYGALLDAARRGVFLRILLDGKLGDRAIESLSQVLRREPLPIRVKQGFRMMHQKYIVNVNSCTVLTGTANLSTDASGRHSEHRLRVIGNENLASQFAADFEIIWNRVKTQVPVEPGEKN